MCSLLHCLNEDTIRIKYVTSQTSLITSNAHRCVLSDHSVIGACIFILFHIPDRLGAHECIPGKRSQHHQTSGA